MKHLKTFEKFEIKSDLPKYNMTPHHVDMWYDKKNEILGSAT
jgi:hypothetical protein